MFSSKYSQAALALLIFLPPLVQSQFVSSLPQCVQKCIQQSDNENCSAVDIACLCRASAGNFLPDIITCIHGNCDNNLDNSLLLTPLQFVCELAGTPIPDSAIRNAENQASSLATQVATQVTTTVTMGGSSASGGAEATTTVEDVWVSTVTVTTTQKGLTLTLEYPVTVEKTTTVSGSPSTVTATASPSNGFTGAIPVIIVSTDSQGSTYTSTTAQPGVVSTYTTTDSRESTITQKSTITETSTASGESQSSSSSTSGSSDTSSDSSTTLVTTTVAAGQTSASSTAPATSRTSSGRNPSESNSTPFTDTNSTGNRASVGNWLGFGVLVVVACLWH